MNQLYRIHRAVVNRDEGGSTPILTGITRFRQNPPLIMHTVVKQCIADAGNLAQTLGLGRVVGRIYAYLYFSPEPRGLADLQDDLHISKGSASMCVRQLEQWGAVRKVHAQGDRRDYYTANDWFGRVLRNVIADVIARRFAGRDAFYARLEKALGQSSGREAVFLRDRLSHIRRFEEKAGKMWKNPLLQRFLR